MIPRAVLYFTGEAFEDDDDDFDDCEDEEDDEDTEEDDGGDHWRECRVFAAQTIFKRQSSLLCDHKYLMFYNRYAEDNRQYFLLVFTAFLLLCTMYTLSCHRNKHFSLLKGVKFLFSK